MNENVTGTCSSDLQIHSAASPYGFWFPNLIHFHRPAWSEIRELCLAQKGAIQKRKVTLAAIGQASRHAQEG